MLYLEPEDKGEKNDFFDCYYSSSLIMQERTKGREKKGRRKEETGKTAYTIIDDGGKKSRLTRYFFFFEGEGRGKKGGKKGGRWGKTSFAVYPAVQEVAVGKNIGSFEVNAFFSLTKKKRKEKGRSGLRCRATSRKH